MASTRMSPVEAVLAAADGDDAGAEDLAHELLSFAAPEGMLAAVIITIETLAAITPAGARTAASASPHQPHSSETRSATGSSCR